MSDVEPTVRAAESDRGDLRARVDRARAARTRRTISASMETQVGAPLIAGWVDYPAVRETFDEVSSVRRLTARGAGAESAGGDLRIDLEPRPVAEASGVPVARNADGADARTPEWRWRFSLTQDGIRSRFIETKSIRRALGIAAAIAHRFRVDGLLMAPIDLDDLELVGASVIDARVFRALLLDGAWLRLLQADCGDLIGFSRDGRTGLWFECYSAKWPWRPGVTYRFIWWWPDAEDLEPGASVVSPGQSG